MDACADPGAVRAVAARRGATVCCSALTGEGLGELLAAAGVRLADAMVRVEAVIPYDQVRGRCLNKGCDAGRCGWDSALCGGWGVGPWLRARARGRGARAAVSARRFFDSVLTFSPAS